MAYLYMTSATFRAIVRASRDPRVFFTFAGISTAGFLLFGRGAQSITDPITERRKHEIEHRVVNDPEAKRYAEHSNRALATLFDTIGKGHDENEHHLKSAPINLPAVAWHPGAERRDEEQQQQKQQPEAPAEKDK